MSGEQKGEGADGVLSGVTDTVGKTTSGVTDTVGNTVSSVGKGVSDTVSGATGAGGQGKGKGQGTTDEEEDYSKGIGGNEQTAQNPLGL